jgi:hypothetical protein
MSTCQSHHKLREGVWPFVDFLFFQRAPDVNRRRQHVLPCPEPHQTNSLRSFRGKVAQWTEFSQNSLRMFSEFSQNFLITKLSYTTPNAHFPVFVGGKFQEFSRKCSMGLKGWFSLPDNLPQANDNYILSTLTSKQNKRKNIFKFSGTQNTWACPAHKMKQKSLSGHAPRLFSNYSSISRSETLPRLRPRRI